MSSVGILIVDDHPAVRAGLKQLISSRPGWLICGEAGNGEEAIAKALEVKPSAIVMDISMPKMDGLEATRRIREQLPNTEVLIVSQHDSQQVVTQAQRAGARGFVLKSHLSADLLPALESALLHNSRISRPVARAWQEAIATARGTPTSDIKPADPGPHDDLDLMSGGGEMGALMRAHDWSKTPFGPVSQWPQSLRTALRICLDSRFPIVIWWGPELRLLYNDAWRPALGTTKHPQALGATGKEVWADVWDTIGPMLESVMRTGKATWENDQLLLFDRYGYVEESYWTYSYSAIRLASGEVGGVFSAVHEVTDRVLGARRLKTLREVADQVVQAKNEEDACVLAMESIQRNPADCPYAFILLCDGKKAMRVAASFDASTRVPSVMDLAQVDSWGVHQAVQSKSIQIVDVENPETLPKAPFGDACKKAITIPILGTTRESIGAITIAISPYRAFDASYREFFESLARNLAANINNARAYDEERKRAESLAELDRAKTVFFSNVSHEFRTPLTLMLGPLEDSLAEADKLPATHRQRLEVAHRNSLRLLRLVNTMLDFSRIEAGRIQACYEPTDLAKMTAELASVFRSATDRAGLKLLVNCSQIDEPVYVDREMWEKIVFNLLSNAFKFTFSGELEVSLRRTDGLVELSVRDTGTGIPEQDISHLFERFYRVKSAHGRTFEGSGIGLALVQELAKLHGGSVRVESKVDQGSTFTVSIPLGKHHLPTERISARRTLESTGLRGAAYVQEALRWLPEAQSDYDESSALLSSAASLPRTDKPESSALILLADDNADMRDYVQRLLKEQYEVAAVPDGGEALRFAREQRPDLILSDIMMPHLDGFGLLTALRADKDLRSIPVILLSARAGEESRLEGLEAGADDYLVKPFSARELLARVRSHLTMAKVRREAAETERKLRAEAEFERSRLQHEIADIKLLQGVSAHLVSEENVTSLFEKILDVAAAIMASEFSTIQAFYPERGKAGELRMLAQRGIDPEKAKFWEWVRADSGCTCGQVLRTGKRAIATDVRSCEFMAGKPDQGALLEPGIQAGQSTPLFSRSGQLLGMISTHWRQPHQPSERDLRLLDILARQAADLVERWQAQEVLRRNARWHAAQKEAFQAAVNGAPLDVSLSVLVKIAIEQTDGEARCAFYLADASGTALHHITGMPASYAKHVDGFKIGPESLSCGLAVHTAQPITTPDVTKEPLWKPWLWLAQQHNFRACWSFPVETSAGKVVGSFAMYFKEPREATPRDRELAALLAQAAGIIISRHQAAEERARAESVLRESEERLRLSTEAAKIGTFDWNIQTGVNTWTPELEAMYGLAPGQFGKTQSVWEQLVHPDDRAAAVAKVEESLATGKAVEAEWRVVWPDGSVHWIFGRFQCFNDSAGKPLRLTGVNIDVTDRKRAEEKLQASESRFRALVNATSEVVYRMSPDWSEMRQLDGRGFISDTEKARTDWLEEYIHADDRELVLRTIREAVRTKSTFQFEHRVRRTDGTLGWSYSRAVPVLDDKRDIIEWFGAASDVTARKEAEENYRKLVETLDAEVRARTRDLEERNVEILRQSEQVRELSWRLLSAQDEERRHIARELHDSAGQTLTVLGMNLVQLVQKAGRSAPELATDAETVQEMVQQLHRDIRTTSYLLHPPLLDESGLYSALSWYTQGLAERSGLEINLDIPQDFGRLPRDMELVVFRLVQECLTNIHRHSGSKMASIRIACVAGQVMLEIQDRGHGVSPQRLTEIQSGRAGVGIRGMRERLRQFAGEMKIHSDGKGTKISVTIPLPKCAGAEEPPTAEPLQAAI